jgi:outer membrane protein assembly factor BamA
LEGGNYIKLYWKNTTTNVTSIDTARIRQTRQLPSVLDLSLNWVGVEYYMQQLDYRFNPRKGIELRANISAGRKRIRQNIAVLNLTSNDFDFSTLYDSLATASVQLRWQGDVKYFIPLARRATLQTRLQTAFLWSSSPLFQNELFRIGGNRTQRGFDEEQIFASAYATLTLEARYLLTTNSYFFGFGDASVVEARSLQLQSRTFPYSVGIGLALDTKIGIFGLSYALGTYAGAPIQVRNAKIHFGYVNMF